MQTRWAVLGPGEISGYFARALPRSQFGMLHAVGSSDPSRASAFASQYAAPVSGTYDDILSRDDVDAVYIGTVHTSHAELVEAALRAGKAVLCEKPATTNLADAERVLAVAAETNRPFLEAFKCRFGPLADRLRALIEERAIGDIVATEASFGFAAGERSGRLFDPDLAGGAVLDAGGYPASFAVGVAAWAGLDLNGVVGDVEGYIGDTGVDEDAAATLRFGDSRARIRTSIVTELPLSATITGTEGNIEIPDVWGSRTESASTLIVRRAGEDPARIAVEVVDPFAAEADALSFALAEGRLEVPQMPWSHTRAVARVLENWRRSIG
ncbi:Gfo/Idh/MocA family oxidoreductase [Microbacterium lacus]|uniref:Gfo/Idh/MocA family protein n=1 Tax=Microbacterium lacus TaxID=415217 RepID=UPI00384DD0AD